jgi:hypothetical protein
MYELGRTLLMLGILLAVVGGAMLLLGRSGVPIGRLPGDIAYRGRNFSFFAPLGTSLLLSVVLSLLLYLLSRFRR